MRGVAGLLSIAILAGCSPYETPMQRSIRLHAEHDEQQAKGKAYRQAEAACGGKVELLPDAPDAGFMVSDYRCLPH